MSETILDEALKHADRIPLTKEQVREEISRYFPIVLPAPPKETVLRYKRLMLDEGDAHLFASYRKSKCDYLVSLDKHHVLALKGKLKGIIILSPAELLQLLKP